MKRNKLIAAVQSVKNETRDALQVMFNALNPGQQKQIIKDESVKRLFERYNVEHGE